MGKKKKLFEPIRRGASSLPTDFKEELKNFEIEIPSDFTEELKKMEIVFPYPKKIDENKYEIAPGVYCNKNVVKDYKGRIY